MDVATKLEEADELQLDSNHKAEEPNASIKYGEDAFADVSPLCEVACIVSTPTKKLLRCKTRYIGMHSNNIILLEMPDISVKETAVFMQRGYPLQVCVLNSKGEGSRIYFKSKIEYVLNGGNTSLLLVTLPKATQVVVGLRDNARLELSIDALLDPERQKYLCQIRDISQSGCLIVLDRSTSNYRVGNCISLQILEDECNEPARFLHAVVKNVSQSNQYKKYGVRFEEQSVAYVSSLIEKLNFCQLQQKFTL